MKVFKDKKEVVDAKVICSRSGHPYFLEIDGVKYDAGAFEFSDEKTKDITKEKTDEKTRARKTSLKK